MKKIITSIILLILIIGGIIGIYLFINDQANKKELAQIDSAEFVDQVETEEQNIGSEIILKRESGVWSIVNQNEYTIDLDSINFEFTGYRVGGSHDGTFENIDVIIGFNDQGLPVTGKITIDASSVKTDTAALDNHLRTDDFFGVEEYPEIIVDIKQVRQENGQTVAISDIFMKGITRTIAIPVEIRQTDDRINFSVDSRINISDFNIAYGPVRDDVRITLQGAFIKN